MEIITVRLSSRDLRQDGYGKILRSFSNANPSGGIMPRLAFDRKDTA
jgi:hypothetical protein